MVPNNSSSIIAVPQDQTREAIDAINTKFKQIKPISPLERYNHKMVSANTWLVKEQPVKTLPLPLTELISLQLRDECNALIEETRQLNNQYVGLSFAVVTVQTVADLTFIELRHRLLVWGEEVIKAVLYKHRRQFNDDPMGTYLKHLSGFLSFIDHKIAHGRDHLYSLVWSSLLDAMPYWMLDKVLFQSGKVSLQHTKDATGVHQPNLKVHDAGLQKFSKQIMVNANLYGVEPTIYSQKIILQPLLTALKAIQHFPEPTLMRQQVAWMMGDILEAVPYLQHNKCAQDYLFDVPGTSSVGGFVFILSTGVGNFAFNDSREHWIENHHRSGYRGTLELDFFGSLTYYMHPWLSLERSFGADDGLILTYWLLKQMHATAVQEYLRIEQYYLHAHPEQTPPEGDSEAYVPPLWQMPAMPDGFEEMALDQPVITTELRDRGVLPQMRRTRFFKVLGLCGVRVEQGKGSELKLLKDGAHPFRLGNHYGPNPTVPYFMVDSILKRMQISHEQWSEALAAV